MSDTPRTDAAAYDSQPDNPMVPSGCWVVPADLAREIERENAKLTAQLAWLRANCRVVFYPAPPAYPIEHLASAGKDQWDLLISPAANR